MKFIDLADAPSEDEAPIHADLRTQLAQATHELGTLTLNELEDRHQSLIDLLEQLHVEITSIRNQLAARNERVTGEYADADWWQRAQTRLRFRGRDHQNVQNALATINRQIKLKRQENAAQVLSCLMVRLRAAAITQVGEAGWLRMLDEATRPTGTEKEPTLTLKGKMPR
jgi:hypothetical protein